MGPQLGYFYPEIVLEADLHGPGIKAQGALVPGGGALRADRPDQGLRLEPDHRRATTTATSSSSSSASTDGRRPRATRGHYVYKGQCRAMSTLRRRRARRRRPDLYPTTVHGPVVGHGHGRRQAVRDHPPALAPTARTRSRSPPWRDMTDRARPHRRGFWDSANQFGFTFNWAYANRDTTATSRPASCRAARPASNKLLPTLGTGDYDWRGFLSRREHPHDVGPPGRPAPQLEQQAGAGLADRRRRPLLRLGPPGRDVRRLPAPGADRGRASSMMNRAATEDLRATEVWPVIRRGARPAGRRRRAAPPRRPASSRAWRAHGGSKLDRDLDGKVDDPGRRGHRTRPGRSRTPC